MHIPEPLHGYDQPTLLVVADGEHAKLFLLNDREVNPVGELTIDYPPKDDVDAREADTFTPGGIQSAHTEEKLDMEKERRFSKIIAADLMRRLQREEFEQIILAAPQEHLNEFLDALHNDVRARLMTSLGKTLMKEPVTDVIERIQKTA